MVWESYLPTSILLFIRRQAERLNFMVIKTYETLWATLDQMSDLFGRDKSVISRHIRNIILSNNELKRNSVVAKNATTASDGKVYQVVYCNLDVIISVV